MNMKLEEMFSKGKSLFEIEKTAGLSPEKVVREIKKLQEEKKNEKVHI